MNHLIKTLTTLLIVLCLLNAKAQNLINNAGFETFSGLPSGPAQYALATGWLNCNGGGSPDYFHINGTGIVQLPNCFVGSVNPHSGSAIMGYCPYYPSNSNFREYVTTQLSTPLTVGTTYNVSFYVTNGTVGATYGGLGIDKFSVALTVGQPFQSGTGPIATVTPQYTYPGFLYSVTWQKISFNITATQPFNFITFGSFADDASTGSQTFAPATNPLAYYFLDDGELKIAQATYLNTCYGDSTQFVNPTQSGQIGVYWNFGDTLSGTADDAYTTDANHLFTSPGTYTVTTINYYLSGINDTLYTTVTIGNTPTVNLGNDTTLCNGDSLLLNVQSGYTSYLWSDGSTGNSLTVSLPGLYYVSVTDNGCASSDSVLITNTNCSPVLGFSSSDTTFCEKQCLDFFDLTTNNPTSWQWLFTGGSPDTSTLQNPTGICYNSYGSFDVRLIACNAFGCDTVIYTNFITELQNPTDSIWSSNDTLFSLPAYSYQWYELSTGLLAGETNPFYIVTQPGSYYCVINDSIGCVATSNIISITGLIPGHTPSTVQGITLVPNPSNGQFTVSIIDWTGKADVAVYDMAGRKLFGKTISTPGITFGTDINLCKGIYTIAVTSNGSTYYERFIIGE